MGCKVFALIGRSGSGKTTLLTQLLSIFKSRGVKVATIKHTHHDVQFDQPGKDSWKHRQYGADQVMLLSGTEMAIFGKIEPDTSLEEIKTKWFSDYDLLIVEGFKNEPVFKLEVIRKENNKKPLYQEPGFHVNGIISDEKPILSIPCFLPAETDKIVDWIFQELELRQRKRM